ncbi:atrial natriuretic peptide receptor 1-like [Styela clava]
MQHKHEKNILKIVVFILILLSGEIIESSSNVSHSTIDGSDYISYGVYTDSTNNTVYEINMLFTIPFDQSYIFSRERTEPAIYQALRDAEAVLCSEFHANRSRIGFPKDTCFNIIANDSQCDADYAMNRAVDIQDFLSVDTQCTTEETDRNIQSMNVFVGLSCDWTAGRVGALANNWRWPAIFPGVRGWTLDDKNQGCCETLTRPGHTATDIGKFVLRVYDEYNWNNSYIIYTGDTPHGAPIHDDTRSDCATFVAGMIQVFEDRKWTADKDFTYIGRQNDEILLQEMETILNVIKNNARVSVWCVGRKAMKYVMNKAYEKGMADGDFAFLYLDIYNTNVSYEWSDEDDQDCKIIRDIAFQYNKNYSYCDMNVSNSNAGMRALQVVSLYQPQTEKFEKFSNSMKIKIGAEAAGTGQFINPYVTQFYNSVRLLINGINKSISENITNFSDGRSFARQLWNTTFESVDGLVTITETGDRVMDYTLFDMNHTTNRFEIASIYFAGNQTYVEVAPIDWPGNQVPLNIPECGSYTPCVKELSTVVQILIAVAIVLLVCLLATAFFANRQLSKERLARKMLWKVDPEDVDFFEDGGRISSQSTSIGSHSIGSEAAQSASNFNGRQIFTNRVRWKNRFVAVKKLTHLQKIIVDHELAMEFDEMLLLDNEHICKFLGVSIEEPVFLLNEYCLRGSLQDFLEGETGSAEVDENFSNYLIMDIAHGMQYLHKSHIHSHGNLKSSNCLVDSRFVVKIADYGLPSLRSKEKRDSVVGYNHYKDLLWTAPELLRMDEPPPKGTQKGDTYSFAIIVQEIFYRKGVFYLGEIDDDDVQDLTPNQICDKVMHPIPYEELFRPTLLDNDDVVIDTKTRSLIKDCWNENPEIRPTFVQIFNFFKKTAKYRKQNLVDSLLDRLEKYSNNLEMLVMERTDLYKAEKERADTLLYQMLPKSVAERLKRGQDVLREKFDCVTIYFSDIVGFTAISHESNPSQVVKMLDDLYTMFDRILDKFRVYKVETIGDAYMVASGLPERNGKEHVQEIARMSLDLMDGVEHFEISHMPGKKMNLRVGIHSGSVVAGVVGQKMPRYCLFGDTVNTAARMEQNGEAMRIHISNSTKELLDEFGSFITEKRDTKIQMKGLGSTQTWWLEGEVEEQEGIQTTRRVSAKIEKEFTGGLTPKRISDSSGFSSARTSIEDGAIRISVMGVEEEYDHSEDDSLNNPNLVSTEHQHNLTVIQTRTPGDRGQNHDDERRSVTSESQRRVRFQFQRENESYMTSPSAKPKSANGKRYLRADDNDGYISDSERCYDEITSM